MLSPLAEPFMPTREGYTEFASFAAIYNDGVPEGLVCGSHADHYVIHNIPDSAIDEIFPPDAADAAEMDATDDFLALMIDLSFLEEREEMTRANYGHSLQKRWEARRQMGLVNKPHMASVVVGLKGHGILSPNEMRLVHFDRHHRAHNNLENRRRLMEAQKHAHHQLSNRNSKRSNGYPLQIQQPRKVN